ncbi:immunoglobulin lambda-1 light chain-like [Protopterus annectens]|uniref:immunoglobulin lambda-1 light chain-like n=1 Tax=Protopterus annectens TaxID=7888 RepID=UPI001CFA35CB|nr:immunoglobulin lambda-1 light chain-like [Protopterus annectens]
MSWFPATITLMIIFLKCVNALTLNQPSSVTSSSGDTVTLPCTGSEGISNKYVHWYQQKAGKAPRLLIYKDSSRASGIPERFSGSGADSSSNTAKVTITGVQTEDEADYYCQVWDSNVAHSDIVTGRSETKTCGATEAIQSQLSLSQPPSQSATLGETVKLPCTLSGVSISGKTVYWYQQHPGAVPRFLLYYTSSTSKGSGVPDRFSGSKDNSQNICYLTISGVQAQDEADYYCKVWDSGPHSDTVTG